MDALGKIARASEALAPSGASGAPNEAHDLTTTAATPTAATATGINTERGGWFTVTVGVAFNIRFGGSSVGDPADTAAFPAGMYHFLLQKTETYFKITANATGKAAYWRSAL